MNCYGALAGWYDNLTGDIPYDSFADWYEAEFHRDGGEFRLLLDLCCGTGSLTNIMAERGYEMIGVDSSVDMLMQAQSKSPLNGQQPLYLCQPAEELDLYGTVDACFCSLDGMNYIPHDSLTTVFGRLKFFIRPDGLFIFDIHPEEWFEQLDGEVFIDETDRVFCTWRADYDTAERCICYGMDLFEKQGRLWQRRKEEHIEYAHSFAELKAGLEANGFTSVMLRTDCPQGDNGRVFITARRANV